MKGKRTDRAGGILSLFLALLLCVQLVLPALAVQESRIEISSPQDLLELSKNCKLDTWSQGKTVVLTSDISLAGIEYSPIPTFGGTFDGNGHTITGLDLFQSISTGGLFGILQEGAVVHNLRVSGNLTPSGKGNILGGLAGENNGLITDCAFSGTVVGNERVGGMVGLNGLTGQIRNCTVSGNITGKSMTGGITGENRGAVVSCRNDSYVNITSLDPGIDLTNLDLELSNTLFTLKTLGNFNVNTDTGGVAGYSSGMVTGCVNSGVIGYQHTGYNTGGIVGRSCGHVANCVNRGQVFGRKDIGGIVGQAEPYILLDLSKDVLKEIQGELNRLRGIVNRTADHADHSSDDISAQLSAIGDSVDAAIHHTQDLTNQMSDYTDGVITEINRGGDILAEAMDRMAEISKGATALSKEITAALDQIEQAIRQMARIDGSGVREELEKSADDLVEAGEQLEKGTQELADGMKELSTVVQIKDEEAARAALDKIISGLSNLSAAAQTISRAIETLVASAPWNPEWGAAAQDVVHGCQDLASALERVSKGVTGLHHNITFDFSALQDGFRELHWGMETLSDAMDDMTNSVRHMKEALKESEDLSQQLKDAANGMADGLDALERAGETGTGVLTQVEDLFAYLSNTDPIQFAHPSEEMEASSDALYDTLEQIRGGMERLNSTANSTVGSLTDDIRATNQQLGTVIDLMIDTIYDMENTSPEDRFSDTSEEDINGVTSGKIASCTNMAVISGDLCVGGVAGSMAVEYELDPEDDLLSNEAPIYRKAFELKAILQGCSNTGEIVARRNYAGSVCGRMDLGLAVDCRGYGKVSSENGDYVGGISGFATGAIQSCVSKCTLSGGSYVGGIVGAAAAEGAKEGGRVSNCYAYVEIPTCERHTGAISGADRGTFHNNFYVSDDLAGLDRVSVVGRAEPISYEAMAQRTDLPPEMGQLHLRFLVDGTSVKTVSFQYGDSFDASIFPKIPKREGEFGSWDRKELTNLRFDTDVTAVYERYLIALPSEQRRDDGRSVLFVEGDFGEGDALTAEKQTLSQEDTAKIQTPLHRRDVLEWWKIQIPGDGQDTHTIRYLSPNGKTERVELYQQVDGEWEQVETETAGSYLLFQTDQTAFEMAVVHRTSIWWVWLVAILLLGGLGWLFVQGRRRFKLTRMVEGEKKETTPQDSRKLKRRKRIAVAAVLLTVCFCGVLWFFASGMADKIAVMQLLRSYSRRPDLWMEMTLQGEVGDRQYQMDGDLARMEVDGHRVMRMEQLGAALYYCDGKIYLEDGRIITIGDGLPNYDKLLSTVKDLYREGKISVFSNSGERIYSITVSGEQASSLLNDLLPQGSIRLDGLKRLDLDLTEKGKGLSTLRLSLEATLDDPEKTPLSLTAQWEICTKKEGPEIPQTVRDSILNGSGEEENLLPLLVAWERLNARDPLTAQLSFGADCGPLVFRDEMELFRTYVEGQRVNIIQKSGHSLYVSEGLILDEKGNTVADVQDGMSRLLETIYRLSLQGALKGEEKGGNYRYTLTLNQEEILTAVHVLLPEVETWDPIFREGQIQVDLSDGEIVQISFDFRGSVQILNVDVPASITGRLTFQEGGTPLSIPDPVAESIEKVRS